ncbi:MAG: UvrD-helicase domain-containing protein [Clostridia bacterium]|nr:UvrD-helicase domain-containing protein [Clostridia bacterium]
MPNFTPSQQAAIETKNVSIVVSAGAGSGKTTVMTERILRSILDGRDINRYLIVTFTKAAASDVREKLYKGLMKAQAQNPADRHIARQLMSLPGADISTVHAFCFSRIKRSFSLLGITPDIRAADETEANLLLAESMEKALNQGYEKEEEGFMLLADAFSGRKSDKRFADAMLGMYKALRVYPHPWEFLDTLIASLEKDCQKPRYEDTDVCAVIMNEARECLLTARKESELLSRYAEDAGESVYLPALYGFTEDLDDTLSLFPAGYGAVKESINALKNPRFPLKGFNSPEEKEYIAQYKNKIFDEIKAIRGRYFLFSSETHIEDMKTSLRLIKAAKEFLKEFEDIYDSAKRKNGVIDFSDQEHLMLSLLEKDGNPTQLCLDMREGFDEIYVDEYQDTNPLQDRIFTLLSGDNRFMVGDVKQSIYRFRSAHPDIFRGYCNTYGKEGSKSKKVILRENFRCDESIISFCNQVFLGIPQLCKQMNYGEESLIFAKNENTGDTPVTFTAVTGGKEMTAEEKQTAEAKYIAKEIISLIGKPKNDGTPICYGDIALLFTALKSNISVFTEVFEKAGIPCRAEKSENLLDRQEILLAVSALKAVDNPTADIPLAAVMRSPLFGFTADEMLKIRRSVKSDCLYDCVLGAAKAWREDREKGKSYRPFPSVLGATPIPRRIVKAERGYISRDISGKCKGLLTKIHLWRISAEGTPAHRFIWQLYNESGIIPAVLAEESGEKRYRNLMLLYDYARRYEESSYKGLSAFLKYLEETETLEEAKAPDDGGNTVKLMTIHRSKGLEFPVVFIADTDREFRLRDSGDFVLRKDGIGVKFSQHNGMLTKNNCVTDSLLIKETRDQTAEEARKLYVALTRARERLYITAKCEEFSDLDGDMRTGRCHADWICRATERQDTQYCRFLSVAAEDMTVTRAKGEREGYLPPADDISARISFVYPEKGWDIPAKISVSEIRPGLLEEEEYTRTVKVSSVLRKPKSLCGQIFNAADKGTANHLFMQFASFENALKKGTEAEANRLAEKGFITPEQLALMDFKALNGFFRSDLYRRMSLSPRLYREKRFSVEESDTVVGGTGKEKILVQGVIDCFFQNPDGTYTVVDYKTDRTRDRKELVSRHKAQISFYCAAVERMTGKRVSKAVIYSFSIGDEVEVMRNEK